MADKPSRKVVSLLNLIEDKNEEALRYEQEIEKARQKLENKETGWSKARYNKLKMEYSEKIRGIRATVNRLEKQRLNIERREREEQEEEDEEIAKELAIEAEEERLMAKARRAKLAKKKLKTKKTVKAVERKGGDEKEERALSKEEQRMFDFASSFVRTYRTNMKSKFEKKDRKRFELYGKYPYKVTVVYKEPEVVEKVVKPEGAAPAEGDKAQPSAAIVEKAGGPFDVMLVFSHPNAKELELEAVEDKQFDLGKYKDIFRTVVMSVEEWSPEEAQAIAEDYVKRDTS